MYYLMSQKDSEANASEHMETINIFNNSNAILLWQLALLLLKELKICSLIISIENTFLQDFLNILKHSLQNF